MQAISSDEQLALSQRIRDLKDRLYRIGFSIGGISVIFFVLLIMFFFIYVVTPLFLGSEIDKKSSFFLTGEAEEKTLYYGLDEYNSTALRVTNQGQLYGYSLENKSRLFQESLPLEARQITSYNKVNENQNTMVFGLSDGSILLGQYQTKVSYPNKVKTITPQMLYPFGQETTYLADTAIEQISARHNDSEMVLVWQAEGANTLGLARMDIAVNYMDDSLQLSENEFAELTPPFVPKWIRLGGNMRNLYLISAGGKVAYYDISNLAEPQLLQTTQLTQPDEALTLVQFLLGEYSLLVGTDQGRVAQWFPARNEHNEFQLNEVRAFELGESPVTTLAIEHARKGFAIANEAQQVQLLHSTSESHLGEVSFLSPITFMEISPRADGAVIETADGQLHTLAIENKHPEVSMKTLWGEVWYEGYEAPEQIWQSSSSSSDFEPKFSLMPLTWGTIKAALYSMLFAVPIAILAALYTAFFMDKKTRQIIKPTIELIEALPTVILGFLAGLWLAPMMEANLAAFFAVILILPLGIIVFGYAFSKLPEHIRHYVPISKRALLMIPVLIFLIWLAFALNKPIESAFFDGDMRHWLTASAGIDFDQRNAMVIGFAMGFALIPTIFSVAEDAIYNVPAYLVNGSLALGASGWQTVVGVVLPTASPGIFSAIMLGFGRGIGETMIILMASGNTPLMEVNIFEGMRTLAANLAVEMPETEVNSSHYRVLFLSGLLLFIFTFFFNTLAEVVRERMRRKYGSL